MRAKLASDHDGKRTACGRLRDAFGNGGPGRACGAFVAVLRNHAETSSLKSMVNLLKSAVLPVRVIRSADVAMCSPSRETARKGFVRH
jgi:hypothetical protein